MTAFSPANGQPIVDVDRLLVDVVLERARLVEALSEAKDRLVAAETRLHVMKEEARGALAQLTAAAEAELARLEELHHRAADAITGAAAREAAEIVTAVREGSRHWSEARSRPDETDR